MPPEAVVDADDEQYASEDDSDFAPDDAPDQPSDSDGDDDGDGDDAASRLTGKGRRADGRGGARNDDGGGYDNSGDEVVIAKGRKRQKRARDRGDASDDEAGGEGGLVKTRRQRAAHKEERRFAASQGPVTIDVDALWQQMVSETPKPAKARAASPSGARDDDATGAASRAQAEPGRHEAADTIRIKRTYNFAGRVHTEEKVVARDSAEAKLYLASSQGLGAQGPDASPAKRATKKAFRSAFEPVVDAGPGRTDLDLGVAARLKAAKEARATKLNTVEKSRMDWAGYVDKEGIKDELELASKSKSSYGAREAFLARSEARRDDEARRARMAART